ncbi:MAG: hypothetical protein FWG71_01125 [Synergistaceae bacterium]|nr:hypothetical protein [Synergistaceae bacterium]
MSNFENTLRESSLAILRRELTESERIEFLELAGAIGMNSVEDYMYMLMIFKRNEDKISAQMDSFKKEMKARFDEMGFLEKKIDGTLEKTLENMLGKGAEKIGYAMGRDIADSAKEVLKRNGELHFLRGQVVSVCIVALMATLAYWLGRAGVFSFGERGSFLKAFFWLPAGGVMALCSLAYTFVWYFEHEWRISEYLSYKINFALQILVFLALLICIFA